MIKLPPTPRELTEAYSSPMAAAKGKGPVIQNLYVLL